MTIEAKRDANGPVITIDGAPVTTPSNNGGIIFEQISQYTIIRSNLGFTVSAAATFNAGLKYFF